VKVAPNEVELASTWLWSSFSNLWRAYKIIVEIHTQQNSPHGFTVRWRRVKTDLCNICLTLTELHGKNGFVTATKLGTTNEIFVAANKNFAAETKGFVDRTEHDKMFLLSLF